ncbi:MAG: hypothetical protein EAZ30_04180 [Betaproteobacteria bacterium]|nr:MAG: hypothetical protein EAZ30_04180 [Betaproteobacteria bacterium]
MTPKINFILSGGFGCDTPTAFVSHNTFFDADLRRFKKGLPQIFCSSLSAAICEKSALICVKDF